ncbi:YadA-like family protein [Rhizobium sp. CC1099]|uniref:YadA-like family protein n=1 Tax=Rhizobium sp. CC1099 TaxID=3039160 RepID=UPI0024B1F8E9|nr:YadA-like family protein [Rhizobium sp. CC1099]WFU86425.1 YadA-like family protein [Rhizobium sp. CC1099]
MTSIQGTIVQRRPGHFAESWWSGAHKGSRSLRRRLMMALRLAHRALGPRRDRLGCGMLGIGGSFGCVMAAMFMITTPALAQYAAGGGSATGSGSVAVGPSATATGLRGVAVGSGATQAGIDSIAQGTSASAGNQNAIAIGFQSVASQLNSVYLGARTVAGTGATAVGAIGIGTDVRASQLNAVAIGTRSSASGQYAVALGQDAAASGTGGAMALGAGTISSGINSVALGVQASATAAGASALGTFAVASGGNSTAVGVSSTASATFATAVGREANASALSSFAGGYQATASGESATALGPRSTASGSFGTALGNQAQALSFGGVALGSGAVVGSAATSGIALGNNANSSGAFSTAVGIGATSSATGALALGGNATAGANASGVNAIAVGGQSAASAASAIAIGTNATADSADAVAMGTNAVATGGKAVSIGSGNVANGNGAVAIGDPNTATGDGAVAQGMDNTATGSVAMGNTNMVGGGGQAVSTPGTAAQGAVGIGYQNTVAGQGAVAIGDRNIANGASAIAMGSQANAAAANAMALGAGAAATNAGAVALGSGSTTAAAVATPNTSINGTTYNFAGTTPTSTVSIGAPGAERTITNVAAGRISSTSTDAINGSQLFATNQAITAVGSDVDTLGTSVSTALGGTSAYNATTNQVTAGLAIGGTTYNSVQSALSAVSSTASAGWNLQANGDAATNVAPGGTVQLLNGQNISVTRSGTDITIATTPALTADSLTLSSGQVFDASGLVMNGTGISGLLDGTVSSTSTEAINGSQLYGASLSIANILGGGATVNPDGTVSSPTYTIAGNSYTTVGGAFTAIDNSLTSFDDALTGGGIKYFHANSTLADSNAVGIDSVAIGPQSVATGNNSFAAGSNAQASADASLAIGQNTQSTVLGAVALGSGSVADRAIAPTSGSIISGTGLVPYNTTDKTLLGAVSVGNSTSYRQITNVADGTEDQDAATIRQLKGALASFAVSPTTYFHANSTASDSLAVGVDSVAIGPRTTVNGDNGIGMGNGAVVQMTAPGGIAIGQNSTVNLADGIALGTNSTANGVQAMALGAGATASEPGSVALGAGSTTAAAVATTGTTINGVAYTFAGASPTSTVSVGSAGSERTITNVAAGRISAVSTDAINGSQLYATNQAVESLQSGVGDLEEFAVKYDENPDGTRANSLTLVGGDPSAPVIIHNVGTGVADTDAVNVRQMNDGMSTTLAESKSYTDGRVTWAVDQAHSYTDQVAGTTLEQSKAYTDSRLSQLNTDIGDIRGEARQAAAIGLAAASLRYDDRPGKLSVAVGGGFWRNEGAFAFGAGYTSETGRVRANLSGTTAGGAWGVGAGLSVTLN